MSQRSDIQLLYEAAEFARFDAAAGWPSEVTPPQLIALWTGHEYLRPWGEPQTVTIQGPDGHTEQFKQPDPRIWERGTETEKKRKACKVAAMMLRGAGLATEERTETIPRPPLRKIIRLSPVGVIEEEQPPEVRKWAVVTRHAVQQCLNRMGMPAPEYIRAWLALEEAHQDEAKPQKPRGRKPSDAPAQLVEILDALESYAAATGQDFDRNAMPGPLGKNWGEEGSFHWLCAEITPVFRKAKSTFETQRAGLCALRPYALPTDFYRRALPHIAPKLRIKPSVHNLANQGRKPA